MKKQSLRWLLFLIPLIVLAPVINRFIYPRDSAFSDLATTFYPNALQVHNAFFQSHILPFWSENILSGYPFAADTQSGLWYLPIWLANIFPSATSLNILMILHLILAGVGMYLLLKREGLTDLAALVGGLIFELTPKVWAHIGAGHFTLVMAVCWTSWLLLAEGEFIRSGYALRRILLPGMVLGVIILVNPIWVPFAALLWVAYGIVVGIQTHRDSTSVQASRWLLRLGGGAGLQVIAGLLISAPMWLPLAQLTGLSSRVLMTSADNMLFSLPFLNVINLFIPNIAGMQEWVVYPGIFCVFLMTIPLWGHKKRPITLFWLFSGVVCLIISFGENLPLIPYFYRLPFFGLLRVPTRFFFLACLSGAALSAYGFDLLLNPKEKPARSFKPVWIGFAFFMILFSAGIPIALHKVDGQYLWASVGFALTIPILLLWDHRKIKPLHIGITLIGLILVDLLGVNLLGLKFRSQKDVLAEGAEIADWIKAQPGDFRVYSPSYSLPQQTAAVYGLRQADGINPLELLSYVQFMEKATGIPITHYSVSMPDFPTSSPATDNEGYVPDMSLLGLLNVRFVLSEFDLSANSLELEKTIGSTRIYENKNWLPRAWVQSENASIRNEIRSTPHVLAEPNEIALEANGPGLLVLSEIAYPGWRVFVNGKEQPLLVVDRLLRAVMLTEANSQVVFTFQPVLVYVGLGIAGVAWIGLAIFYFILIKRKDKPMNPHR